MGTESAQMFLLSSIDFWTKVTGFFSTVLLTLLATSTGLVIWKQFDLKRAAEKEFKNVTDFSNKISEIFKEISGYHKAIVSLADQAKMAMNEANKFMKGAVTDIKALEQRLKGREKLADITLSEISKYRQEIETKAKSLATTSRLIPDYTSSFDPKVVQSALDKLLGRIKSTEEDSPLTAALKKRIDDLS